MRWGWTYSTKERNWGAPPPSPCVSPQSSAWVTVFLWCLLSARLLLQRQREPRIPLLHNNDPECGAEAEATFGGPEGNG